MRFLLLILASAMVLDAQTPAGTVTVTTAVVATAGTDAATQVICTLALSSGVVHADCKVGGTSVQSSDSKPLPGDKNGYVGSVTANSNSVTWMLQQPDAAGPISWQIAANGITKSGTF